MLDATASPSSAQWWLLYAVLVANKDADQTERKLRAFLGEGGVPPYAVVRAHLAGDTLATRLREVRTGQYRRVEAAFRYLVTSTPEDPRDLSLEILESVPGIGPKTSRWYWLLLHPEAGVAALDTHVLRFLRDQGVDAPRATPPLGRRYRELEAAFLAYARRLGLSPRGLDYFVWAVYRAGGKVQVPTI